MKNRFLYFLFSLLFFAACQKDDDAVFNKSPDERLNEALTAYQTQLTGATDGWKAFLYPRSGGVYSFYFKFNDANRVSMLSSFDSASAVTFRESSYRLKALQQPSLLFDTYSYLHVLSDPDAAVNGGLYGVGLQSDFEFYFDSSSADTINLVGRINGSRVTLVKATSEEATGFSNGQLATGFLLNKLDTYFKRLSLGSEKYDFHINPATRTLSLVDATGNLLDSSISTGYYMTFGGVAFNKPLMVGNESIAEISGINYDAATKTISCNINDKGAIISNVAVPLKADLNAPRRWWNAKAATEGYWFSIYGFHANGVDNAYRLDTLTAETFPYYFLIYYPRYGQGGEDLFGPIFLNSAANQLELVYGSAANTPGYTSDGRAIFTELGVYPPFPASGAAANTSKLFYNRRGYYFVQTSQESYDMVSAQDGRSWISWL